VSSSTGDTTWIKSTRSGAQGDCVEMRRHRERVEVRDSKAHGTGPSLDLAKAAFAAWLEGAKRGQFDHLRG
jgi:hypothetical protein